MRANAGMFPWRTLNSLIIIVRDTDEYSHVGPVLQIKHQTRILYRLPSDFQHQTMLGIHVGRFSRRDPEKLWVEFINSLQKTTPASNRLAGQTGFSVEISFDVPTVRRHIGHGLAALDEKIPEGLCIIHAAWEAAANSNDCDTIFRHREHRRLGRKASS